MSRVFLLIIALFNFIIFLHFPTTGHDVLLTPFNIFIWEIFALSIFIAGLYIQKQRFIQLPKHSFLLLSFPTGMIFSGFFSGQVDYINWMFRLAAIIMGLLFFYSLFQFQTKRRTIDNAIYIVIAAMLTNAIVSFLQLMPNRPLIGFIPHPETPRAVGVFMQPNLLASAMVTAIILSFYQCTSPAFRYRSFLIKGLCYTTIFAASLIVLSSGSRIGLISLFVSLPMLFYARFRFFSKNKATSLKSLIALFTGSSIGVMISEGAFYAFAKLGRLASEGSEIRTHLYRISWELIAEKPLFGHGLGSFQSVFHEKAAKYLADQGGDPLIGLVRYSHPHNEILYWAIEGGAFAVAGLMLVATIAVLQAKQLGRERGLALITLMLPITLHTQTELPLYSSSYHWALLLFLAFLLFLPISKKYYLKRKFTLIAVPSISLAILVTTLLFGTSTFSAARKITDFLLYKIVDTTELREAQNNIYFNEYATLLTLKVLLNEDITKGTHHWTQLFINWNEEFIKKTPEVSSFHDLALAYNHIGMRSKAIETIEHGLYLYPKQPVILSSFEKINRIPKTAIEMDLDKVLSPSSIPLTQELKTGKPLIFLR